MQKSDLEVGDHVEYKYRDHMAHKELKACGYIIVFCKSGSNNVAWIGKKPGTDKQKITCVFLSEILRKVSPPQAIK